MSNASDRRFGETQKHTLYSVPFFAKNPAIYEINVEKKMVESDGPQLAI
jgi:hypothetical protein